MIAIGRAGPVCRHAFARLYKSHGDRNSFLLDIPAGHLKGKKAIVDV